MSTITAVLHNFYLICQWHRRPFEEESNDLEALHRLNVMENEEAQEEKAGAVGPEAAKDGSFGSVLHERSRWVCANSSVFTSNLVVMNDCTFYDHSQSQYAFLSMCHDDAGTTTIFSVIS